VQKVQIPTQLLQFDRQLLFQEIEKLASVGSQQ
jgi:hypothetical protein